MDEMLELVCVFEPWTPQDLALAESILSGTEISYHVENEHNARGALLGVGDGRTRVMVQRGRAEEAVQLLAILRGPDRPN